MKPKPTSSLLRRTCAALFFTAAIPAAFAELYVDGTRDAGEGYTQQAVQVHASNWGANQTLANLHTVQDGSSLGVFMAGRVQNNAIILFIDSKAGGVTKITNNLITSGGEEYTINNLGTSPTDGLTFENGFTPDYAVRIFGDGGGTAAYVNRYNLQTGTRAYVGQAVASTPEASGFVEEISVVWADVTDNADASDGVEMKLNLAALGVPLGEQPVKLMAILVNDNSSWGSNQVLASKESSADMEAGVNSINFETEAGTQTISLTVTHDAGDPDDTDGDGLLDIYETNTGIYVSPTDTGSDPMLADTDEDGVSDGDEVLNNAFGFLSNPNIANYYSMAIPGDFTTPEWQVDGSAGNDMTMVDTSLTGQYQWFLDYKFEAIGSFAYKFAANGSWNRNWGDNGNDITATIEATGFYRFTFDNSTLSRSLTRTTYPDVAAYLAAYGLSGDPEGDADSDGVSNQDEFIANTDPTNSDTDGDGSPDDEDPFPLFATRDIVFSVNMNVQVSLGNFDPATDGLVVDFFDGLASPLPDLALSDPDQDGIWTGTLTGFQGPEGVSFGTYKFRNLRPEAPDSGYEGAIDNRTFTLGAANSLQELAVVNFNNVIISPGSYDSWKVANAGDQSANEDFDGDGVPNGVEFFMGETGSSFTANPTPVNGTITWPRDASATGASFRILASENLSSWTDVTASADISDPNSVKYTPPTGSPRHFTRLEVTVP